MWPLGGNEEVGRNSTVFELNGDIIILDLGLMFPEEDAPGVDYIIPNIDSLKGKEKNIRGILLSHGHLDHIGALPYILPKLGNPTVIGSDMTLALAKKRNEEFRHNPPLKTITVKKDGETIMLGSFKVTFFTVAHSVREAFGVVIQAPFINVIHMGDWRYDLDPVTGPPTDFRHLAKWNTRKTPSIIAFESLGSVREGHQSSERGAYLATKKVLEEAQGRIIFGTFSSMLERIGQIIELAEKAGRKVAIDGYSMKASVEIGKRFGYIKARSNTFVDIRQINKLPPKKVCIVATGSQADERSVLVRIANHEHRHIQVATGDTIVFSSSVIPGNERVIQRLKDSLYRQGANVIHKETMDSIHGGGHAKQEDIKLLLKQAKPKYVMPVYANHYLLREAAKLAAKEGWKEDEIFVTDNGQVTEFDAKGPKVTKEKMNTDYVFVDGLGVGDVSNIVLRDRQMLADDGMVVVIATVRRRDGQLVQNPDIISRGFVHLKENRDMVEALRRKARKVVMSHYDPRTPAQDMFVKNKLRSELAQFIMQKTERRPMVLPVVIVV
jgi:ribonuclease J